MSVPSRKERRVEATRREIMEAAARLFFERGFREVTMADIGHEVGLSPGSLYYYFRNKEEILKELDSECVRRFEEFLDEFRPDSTRVREWVLALFNSVLKFARENRDYFLFLTRLVSSVHPHLLGDIVQNRMRAMGKALEHLTQALRVFQTHHEVTSTYRPEELAHFLGGVIHSLMFSWFLGIVPEEEIQQRLIVFTDLFMHGVSPKMENPK